MKTTLISTTNPNARKLIEKWTKYNFIIIIYSIGLLVFPISSVTKDKMNILC